MIIYWNIVHNQSPGRTQLSERGFSFIMLYKNIIIQTQINLELSPSPTNISYHIPFQNLKLKCPPPPYKMLVVWHNKCLEDFESVQTLKYCHKWRQYTALKYLPSLLSWLYQILTTFLYSSISNESYFQIYRYKKP